MTSPTSGDHSAQPTQSDADTAQLSPQSQETRSSRFLTWPVLAWGLWDWGSAAFNAVITTFVFTVYLSSSAFGDSDTTHSQISLGLTIAGLFIALLAPVTGQRSDRAGRTVFWLGAYTGVVVLVSACMFFVLPDPSYLWLGIFLLGVGNIFFELASVNYNGMLASVTTRDRMGAVSGLGWGMGYLGGIVLLLIVFFGFIKPEVGWFGVTAEDGLNVRVAMLVAAAWFGLSALPVLINQAGKRRREAALLRTREQAGQGQGSEAPGGDERVSRESIIVSYKRLWRTLVSLHRAHPEVLWFLVAAAIFRDGLAGVFTYGGLIAEATFGFSAADVIVFAIVANVVAGIATISAGWLDDAIGPRRVIMGALIILVVSGIAVFFLHDQGRMVFWALGLVLSACVGPAQSAARSFLSRLIPAGREGEIFGLYATTGRAVSFIAPAMYLAAIKVGKVVVGGEVTYWGILGIVLVLAAGLLLMLRVKDTTEQIGDL